MEKSPPFSHTDLRDVMSIHLSADILKPYCLHPDAVFDLHDDEIGFFVRYFLGRIEFRIDSFDMSLASHNIAVLGFALGLKRLLNNLSKNSSKVLSSYVNGQDFCFSRDESDRVVVDPTWLEGSACVGYAELLMVADQFLQDLLDRLSLTFPQLVENSAYPNWRST